MYLRHQVNPRDGRVEPGPRGGGAAGDAVTSGKPLANLVHARKSANGVANISRGAKRSDVGDAERIEGRAETFGGGEGSPLFPEGPIQFRLVEREVRFRAVVLEDLLGNEAVCGREDVEVVPAVDGVEMGL